VPLSGHSKQACKTTCLAPFLLGPGQHAGVNALAQFTRCSTALPVHIGALGR